MELSALRRLLELTPEPAFAAGEGRILCRNPQAAALGLEEGPSELLQALRPSGAGEAPAETELLFQGRPWVLRAADMEGLTLCLLRPAESRSPAPNENTLLRTAGSIRSALQDLTTALDVMTDALEADPEGLRQTALALRSVYRLRRTVVELELYARLRAGTYRLCRRNCSVVGAVSGLCVEFRELLRPVGIDLRWELPARELSLCLDWVLIAALLRELLSNAAADAADGRIRLTLSRTGERRLRFTVENRPAGPLPETLFGRHAAEVPDLRTGVGLGLSLAAAAAEYHGGGLLLSADGEGTVTALLSVETAAEEDPQVNCLIQYPTGPEAALLALSPVLPPASYRPEELLV